MEDDTTRTETDEIAGEDLVIERIVEYRERGAIVTLNIESRGTAPTTFTLIDEFSDELPVADAAFRPGADPDGSRIGPGGISFEETIGPDEERTVVYALKFFEPAPDVDLGGFEILEDGPHREESPVGTRIAARGGTMTTVPSSSSQSDVDSSAAHPDVESSSSPSGEASSSSTESLSFTDEFALSSSEAASPASRPDEESDSSSSDQESSASPSGAGSAPSRSDVESAPSPSDEGSSSSWSADDGETIGATLGLFAGDRRSSRRSWATDGGVRPPTRPAASRPTGIADPEIATVDAGPTADGSNGRSDRSNGERDSSGSSASNGSATDASEPADAGGGVVSALVTELQEGSVDEGDLVALRRRLGLKRSAGEAVRFDHIESRMSEFEAYTDALRAVIDEHGTAEEFVGRFEDRIEALRTDVAAVESELSATRETVARVDDRVGTLAADFDSLEERTERELETIREGLDERPGGTEEVAEAVERLERRVEDVESLREQFASVFDGLGGDPV